jgi:hypothetical protein
MPSSLPETGKTLTEPELLRAGLTASELPQDFIFDPVPDGHWTPAKADIFMPTAVKPGCQPLVDLLFGTGRASAEAAVEYQDPDLVDDGNMKLATYPSRQADTFFDAVKDSIHDCADIAYKTYVGNMKGTFKPLLAPKLGDDSMAFGMMIEPSNGITPHMEGYEYVRVGAGTILISLNSANNSPPSFSNDLLAAQVAKLKLAQA